MALVVKNRVKETTATTGTGTLTLAGAVTGFQAFSSALSNNDTTYYSLIEPSTGSFEVGIGTFTASGTTLARTTILASSNSNNAINLTAGSAEVFITQPAEKAVFFDASGDVTLIRNPQSALQAATKQYVDSIAAAGLHYHDPVRVQTTGNLNATYSNGTSGVGATLTNAGSQAAISIDGVTLSSADRVLVSEQTNAAHNGIYTVTTVGTASTNWILTRATDADSYGPSDPDALGQGDAFFIKEGDTNAGHLDVMNTSGTITFGTTNIVFAEVAETTVYSAGNGLTLSGTTFAAGAGTGVTVNTNDISIGQDVATTASPTFNTVTANLTGNVTGNVTGDVTGNADTATAWETARTISLTGDVTGTATGVDGSGNISITTTYNNDVVLGTDTSGNYIATGAVSGNGLSGSASAEGATFTVTSNATNSNTASTIVFRDASGNFSAGTITANLSGVATNATNATNADTVDTLHASSFLRSDANDTATGELTFNAKLDVANDTFIGWGGGTNRPAITGNKSNNRMQFYAGGAERLHIDTAGIDVTGEVGINKSTIPNTGSSEYKSVVISNESASKSARFLAMGAASAYTSYSALVSGTHSGSTFYSPALIYTDTLRFFSAPLNNEPDDTNLTERMRLTTTGLGIGTSSISYPLDVRKNSTTDYVSSSTSSATPYATGDSVISLQNATSTTNRAAYLALGSTDAWGVTNVKYLGVVSETGTYGGNFIIGGRTGSSSYSEHFRIDATGKVGIGTTDSAYPLTVQSTGTSTLNIKTTATNGYAQLKMNNDAKSYSIGVGATDQLYFYDDTSSANRIVIDANGNISMGSSTPTSYSTYRYLDVVGGATTTGGVIQLKTSDGSVNLTGYSSSSGGFLGTTTNHNIYFLQNNSTKMTLDTSGNLGIGGVPLPHYSNYNGATLHLRQQTANYGTQLRFTTTHTGHTTSDGAYISLWTDNNLYYSLLENSKHSFYVTNTERASIGADTSTFKTNLQVEDHVLQVGDISADNYLQLQQDYANGRGFTYEYDNASTFQNLQGSLTQYVVLGDSGLTSSETLFGVSTYSSGYYPRFKVAGNGNVTIYGDASISGSLTVGGSPVGGGPSLTATASGAISNGDPCIVNSDGTVSAVATTSAGGTTGGAQQISNFGNQFYRNMVYDEGNNQLFAFYKGYNNYSYGRIGTVSGNTITWGSRVTIDTGNSSYLRCVYDKHTGHVIVIYRTGSSAYARTINLSSGSFTTGSATYFNNNYASYMDICHDETANTNVVTFRTNTSNLRTILLSGNTSNTTIAVGNNDTFEANGGQRAGITYDASAGCCVIFYRKYYSSTNSVHAVTCTPGGNSSGSTSTFGTVLNVSTGVVIYNTNNEDVFPVEYDPIQQKVLVAYKKSTDNYGYCRVLSVSGTTISTSSETQFNNTVTNGMVLVYNTTSQNFALAFEDATNSLGKAVTATVSGTSVSFSSAITLDSLQWGNSSGAYDPDTDNVFFFYQRANNDIYYVQYDNVTQSTNLTSENYIGISDAAYSNGATATIQIVGSVDDAQSSLTAGQTYYIQNDGSLSTTAATPSVVAGTAVSATKLIVKG